MRLAEYYQSKFYPDLDISVIEEKLSNPEVMSKAVSHLQQTHYPDLPPEKILEKVQQPPKTIYDIDVSDLRKKDPLTGKSIGTGLSTKTNSDLVRNIVKEAKQAGVDPYTALAMSLQETGLGNGWEDNPFHLIRPQTDNPIKESMQFLKNKLQYAKQLGKKSEAETIQAWNGYGKITHKSELGGNMYYGVDVSKTPLDMNKTPIYGNRIIDLRENVIKKNKQLKEIIEKSIFNIPKNEFMSDITTTLKKQ